MSIKIGVCNYLEFRGDIAVVAIGDPYELKCPCAKHMQMIKEDC
jgi:hypothetical protein